jgi:hypothetical protein
VGCAGSGHQGFVQCRLAWAQNAVAVRRYAQSSKETTMRRTVLAFTCALALSVPSIAAAADNYGCDAVNFSAEVMEKMPNAKRLCRGLTEKNNGVYVHYVGKVVSSSAEGVTVDLIDKDNKAVTRVTFVPTDEQTVMLDNKKMKYKEAKPGTKLDFYIEASRWGLFTNPEQPVMKVTKVEHL